MHLLEGDDDCVPLAVSSDGGIEVGTDGALEERHRRVAGEAGEVAHPGTSVPAKIRLQANRATSGGSSAGIVIVVLSGGHARSFVATTTGRGWEVGRRVPAMASWTREDHDGVAVLTFRRPPSNWMDLVSMGELADHLAALAEESATVRVVMLTGGLDGYFIAHADLDDLAKLAKGEPIEGDLMSWFRRCTLLDTMPQPTVAAIDGQAWGGGCETSLACTMRIGSERAHLGQPEVAIGIIPGAGGTQRLPRLVGGAIGAELCLTGRIATAEEAHRIGLLNAVLPTDGFRDAAIAWCQLISRHPGSGGARRQAGGGRGPARLARRGVAPRGPAVPAAERVRRRQGAQPGGVPRRVGPRGCRATLTGPRRFPWLGSMPPPVGSGAHNRSTSGGKAMESFEGKLAVVTGGGTGMGRELVIQLAAEGCHVAACDIILDNLEETARRAEKEAPAGTRDHDPPLPTSPIESDMQQFAKEVLGRARRPTT